MKRPREDNAQRITLHRKCGFAVQVLVAATSMSEGEMRLRLAGVETHDDAQVAKVEMEATFLQDEAYHVCSASVALRELYQFKYCTLRKQGVAVLFGWRTNGKRSKNIVRPPGALPPRRSCSLANPAATRWRPSSRYRQFRGTRKS